MPIKGYTCITMNKEVYENLKKLMKQVNEKAGYRKFRSVSHFIEEAASEYVKERYKD